MDRSFATQSMRCAGLEMLQFASVIRPHKAAAPRRLPGDVYGQRCVSAREAIRALHASQPERPKTALEPSLHADCRWNFRRLGHDHQAPQLAAGGFSPILISHGEALQV